MNTIIRCVRQSLKIKFVPENIGPRSISRREFIEQHVTEFSNVLYNSEPHIPRTIVAIDSTYAYIPKSSNFQALRQSYSMHKNRHLLKPSLVVAPDGFILSIFGPYFSDTRNNDASILQHAFENDADSLREWLHNGDIVLVDRGYRDAIPFLERLGIEHKMPALLQQGQKQLSTEDANDSRIVTKNRWIVEARNGHLRLIFKFFAQTINMQHAQNLNDYYRIAGAILNKYHAVIHMEGATAEKARTILQRSQNPNAILERVERENLTRRNAQWRRLNHQDIQDFPILDLDYLRDLTVGVYQVNLAPSYIQDKLIREGNDKIQIDENINEPR